jgi:RimJ/RimL family protein N-acetyltransferase
MKVTTPILHTERLTLRPITLEDAPSLQAGFGTWAVIQNMSTQAPWPYPEDGALHWLQHNVLTAYRDRSKAYWAITERDQPETAIGVIEIREDDGSGNRGFWIAEEHWGKGYMTEAVSVVTDWVFAHTSLQELIVYNVVTNIGSRRVKVKTGAEFVRHVDMEHHCGETVSEMWRIRKEAWLNR